MSRQLRERRTNAAREAMEAIRGYDPVLNDEGRAAAVYARVAEDIQACFEHHSPKGVCCFDEEQKSCIEDIALHITLLFDAQNHQPNGEINSIFKHIRQLPPFQKWGVIISIMGAGIVSIVNFVGWTASGYEWIYPKNSEITSRPPSGGASKPDTTQGKGRQ